MHFLYISYIHKYTQCVNILPMPQTCAHVMPLVECFFHTNFPQNLYRLQGLLCEEDVSPRNARWQESLRLDYSRMGNPGQSVCM